MFADDVPGTFTILPGWDDLDQPVEDRARAYLHVNCASCHQPGSTGRGLLDLRYGVDLEASGLCEPPTLGDLGVEDPRLVAPGAPERSLISVRAGRRDAYQMPPMGSEQVDVEGLAVVDRWITDLASCP
jgi:mono/diheme cytochrome c family protein